MAKIIPIPKKDIPKRLIPDFEERERQFKAKKAGFRKLYRHETQRDIDAEVWLDIPGAVVAAGRSNDRSGKLPFIVQYWHGRTLKLAEVTQAFMEQLLAPFDVLFVFEPNTFHDALFITRNSKFGLLRPFELREELQEALFTKIRRSKLFPEDSVMMGQREGYTLTDQHGEQLIVLENYAARTLCRAFFAKVKAMDFDIDVPIPPGNLKNSKSEFIVPANPPRIRYRQQPNTFTCKVTSFCSALYSLGFVEEADMIHSSDLVKSNQFHDQKQFNMLVNKAFNKKHKLQFVRQKRREDRFNPLTDVAEMPVLSKLKGTHHCVTFYENLIFEPSLTTAVSCCIENLNLLCGKNGYQGLAWSLTLVQRK